VTLAVSPVYDFLVSLVIAAAPAVEGYEATPAWRALIGRLQGHALLEQLTRLIGFGAGPVDTGGLALLAVDAPPELPAYLAMIEQLPAEQLALRLLKEGSANEPETAPPPALLTAALAGDRAASARLLADLSGERRRQVTLWLADPTGMQAELVRLLEEWYRRLFQPEEARLLAIAQRDAAAKARLLASQGPAELVRAIGGTLELTFAATCQRLVVAPSLLARPAIFLADDESEPGSLWLVVYPVADESLEAPEALAPPRGLVRLYKALADETRLKILRLLAGEELYQTEIAERLGLTKATVSHHMVLLRAAGLVEVHNERRSEIYYRLHRAGLTEPARQLQHFLGYADDAPPR
jgi:DNA-binding transcriptional ArsR family regulator